MRIGAVLVDDIGREAARLLSNRLLQAAREAGLDEGAAEALVIARVYIELPECEVADGALYTLGEETAGLLLQGRTLIIEATEQGIRLQLDSVIVDEATVARAIDYELYAYTRSEWVLETGGQPQSELPCKEGKIVFFGAHEYWEQLYNRYAPKDAKEARYA